MGFFSKIKDGLKKTKENISKKIFEVFKATKLDEDFYEELEMALISSDMGVTASTQIIETLKERIFKEKIIEPSKAKDLLKEILLDSIDYE
ncbi:MAG: signal recognition particle receptor subunit alpha, partial [Clostridia bacterium]